MSIKNEVVCKIEVRKKKNTCFKAKKKHTHTKRILEWESGHLTFRLGFGMNWLVDLAPAN